MGTSRIYGTALVILWDHPHACGDKLASAFNMDKVEGSSPRVWGQASWDKIFEEFPRIIPTRMGTSCPSQPRRCKVWDHPHAYGDKVTTVPPLASVRGSSPRVWGQVCCANVPPYIFGIIPTRMGTRVVTSVLSLSLRDHPHAYGDKSFNYSPTAHIQGSSPRVWGQVITSSTRFLSSGIIPTRMGTSHNSWYNACIK